MKYVGFWMSLVTVGALLVGGCVTVDPAQGVSVSEPGGFADPERRLATARDESYCRAEVLRWRYDDVTGTLKLADSRLLLNCCGHRALHVERIDSIYEITERDEPDAAERRCDSVCAFDFTVAIPEVPTGKAYVRLLRDITDVQGSAELVWQGELDVKQGAGEVVLDKTAAGDACSRAAR